MDFINPGVGGLVGFLYGSRSGPGRVLTLLPLLQLYAEKVATRGLCAIAQAESLRYKLLGGLAVRRYGNPAVPLSVDRPDGLSVDRPDGLAVDRPDGLAVDRPDGLAVHPSYYVLISERPGCPRIRSLKFMFLNVRP